MWHIPTSLWVVNTTLKTKIGIAALIIWMKATDSETYAWFPNASVVAESAAYGPTDANT